jgi:hypothetical protein
MGTDSVNLKINIFGIDFNFVLGKFPAACGGKINTNEHDTPLLAAGRFILWLLN